MKRRISAAVLAAAVMAAACKQPGALPAVSRAGDVAPAGGQAGYATPPAIVSVSLAHDGTVEIRGRSSPEGRIRAAAADGRAYGATVDADGRFAIDAPASRKPMLIAVSAEGDRHMVAADGWLFVPPDDPSRAVMLRPGAPARPLATSSDLIATIDYDAGGGTAVSGRAAPGAALEIAVDGQVVARTVADRSGVFGAHAGEKPVRPGPHELRVTSGARSSKLAITLEAGSASAGQSLNAVREGDSWRVVWSPAGGGSQTTYVFMRGTPS